MAKAKRFKQLILLRKKKSFVKCTEKRKLKLSRVVNQNLKFKKLCKSAGVSKLYSSPDENDEFFFSKIIAQLYTFFHFVL